MSFQNESGGFGNKGSKNIDKSFATNTAETINKMKEKGQKIANENEKILDNAKDTAKKTALGCSAAALVMAIIVFAFVVFIIYKLFS